MVNGRCRSRNGAEYDWLCNGRKVECKSSQLRWDVHRKCWVFRFSNVKLFSHGGSSGAAFDDLLLALYTPRGIYIYSHDLTTGVATNGKITGVSGCVVHLSAS